jgi:hypothetical protein
LRDDRAAARRDQRHGLRAEHEPAVHRPVADRAAQRRLVGRYVIAVPAVRQIPLDELVAWVAPAIQAYLTGPAPAPTRSAPTRGRSRRPAG